jgi:hypothetical protein
MRKNECGRDRKEREKEKSQKCRVKIWLRCIDPTENAHKKKTKSKYPANNSVVPLTVASRG